MTSSLVKRRSTVALAFPRLHLPLKRVLVRYAPTRHCPDSTHSSISAWLSQLACLAAYVTHSLSWGFKILERPPYHSVTDPSSTPLTKPCRALNTVELAYFQFDNAQFDNVTSKARK